MAQSLDIRPTQARTGSSTARPRPACLLCGGSDSHSISHLSCIDLRTAWTQLGVSFSEEALVALRGRSELELLECGVCGFRFFEPALAGGGTFYAELQKQIATYYAANRPEFKWTLQLARKLSLRNVLDVGCGEGAFLDLAKQAGLTTHGVELNAQAIEISRTKGHRIYPGLLADLAHEGPEAPCDLITAFQVLEHVVDPVRFLVDAKRLTRHSGYIAIAVPNEKGIHALCPWDPHQWPPHHITRWRVEDLRHLAKLTGLRLVQWGSDYLAGQEAEYFWNLHNKFASALGKGRYPGGRVFPYFVSRVYRLCGCKFVFPRRGPTIYALYRSTGI